RESLVEQLGRIVELVCYAVCISNPAQCLGQKCFVFSCSLFLLSADLKGSGCIVMPLQAILLRFAGTAFGSLTHSRGYGQKKKDQGGVREFARNDSAEGTTNTTEGTHVCVAVLKRGGLT